jgi:hypothetical protein
VRIDKKLNDERIAQLAETASEIMRQTENLRLLQDKNVEYGNIYTHFV